MKQYTGTKNVLARPMTRGEFVFYRDGTPCRADENPAATGYLVEYTDGNHPDHKGYISWSPADVFERSYKSEGMTFGQALAALKVGARIARKGWNGKGMWLALQTCDENSKMGHNYIYMSDATGKLFPWNPNNLDMLAEDWELVR